LLIAAVQAAQDKHGSGDRRTVLIHGHFQREDQVDAFARLKVFSSLFPMHTFYWGDWRRDHTVGPELADNISPAGWLVKRGLKFTSPPGHLDDNRREPPRQGMHQPLHRRDHCSHVGGRLMSRRACCSERA